MGNSPPAVASIESLKRSLINHGYATTDSHPEESSAALIGRRAEFRWAWAATRLHTFVIAFVERELTVARTRAHRAFPAVRHKAQGWPTPRDANRNGNVTHLSHACASPETVQWFRCEPQHQRAALVLPVLADLTACEVSWFKGHMQRGWYFERHLREVASSLPDLESLDGGG
jgi:hypothetical protein